VLVTDIVFSFAIALVLAIIFTTGFARNQRPFTSRWWRNVAGFSVLVFLATWVGHVWLRSGHPALSALMPLAAAAVIATLFLTAPRMRSPRPLPTSIARRSGNDPGGEVQVILFLVLLIILSILIVVGSAS
jgi:hypothetical protein